MRAAATIKNSIWGLIQQLIICVLSLVSRKVMLMSIGIQGVGLNGLLTNVITLLSLTEMGVGSAIIYHMYKPIADDNKEQICKLMNFYKQAYLFIAGAITVVGLVIVPFLQLIVKNVDFSQGYVTVVFLLFLAQTVATYLFAYNRSLLTAYQKQYVLTIIILIFKVISILGGIGILLLTKSLIWYLVFLIIVEFITNFVITAKVNKMYPFIKKSKGTIPKEEKKEIFKNVKDLFIGKLSAAVTNSTDNILISALVDTIAVGLYSNYTIVINTLNRVIEQIGVGLSGSLGNLVVSESKQYIETVLQRMVFTMFLIASFCSCCLAALINPFVSLMFGKEYLLGTVVVAIIILNFYFMTTRVPVWRMLTVSGLFSRDKYISITGTVINLIVSFVVGYHYGIIGILAGTTCTLVIQYILKINLFYKRFLNMSPKKLYINTAIYLVFAIAQCAVLYFVCNAFALSNPYIDFLLKAVMTIIFAVVTLIAAFHKTEHFNYVKGLAMKFLKKGKKSA